MVFIVFAFIVLLFEKHIKFQKKILHPKSFWCEYICRAGNILQVYFASRTDFVDNIY